jgi:urease accessory protein
LPQQIGEHGIVQQPQLPRRHLKSDMAITQVIGRPQQIQGIGGLDQQQGLIRSLNPHQRWTLVQAQPFARLQRLTAGELEQQGLAAAAMAQTPQAGAFIGAEGQGPVGLDLCNGGGQTAAGQADGRGRWGLGSWGLHGCFLDSPGAGSDGVVVQPSHWLQPALAQSALAKPPAFASPMALNAESGHAFMRAGRGKTGERDPFPSLALLPNDAQPEPSPQPPWHGEAQLRFELADGRTRFQGRASSPLKVQRAFPRADGRCELPVLHTAGGLVGGDRLSVAVSLAAGSRALITSVAAQKVYGSIGRSRRAPQGEWAMQELDFELAAGADLEWLPQELVLYANGLYEQRARVTLAPSASWLGAEVVRLGRTAAGEDLAAGRWRSLLEIRRLDDCSQVSAPTLGTTSPSQTECNDDPAQADQRGSWALVDRLELGLESLNGEHGMAGQAVFGSLVWAAPANLPAPALATLLEQCRRDRQGLEGDMACGALDPGLVARYRGPSTTAARHWFTRIWCRIRAARDLAPPELPRVWPFQEEPLLHGST